MATIIIVPCFNEENRLHLAAFSKFVRQSRSLHFLFVNDGSTDGTAAMLNALATENPRDFSVLHLNVNSGKAEAVRRGMLHGLNRRPTKIGYWDADLATPLDAIHQFAEVLDTRISTELVVGTRMPLLGHDIRRNTLRRFLGRSFARLASWLLRIPIYDTQCGAKLFRVTSKTQLFFDRPFLSRWIFDVELLARMMHASGSHHGVSRLLYELPLDEWEDVADSRLKPRHFLLAVVELAQIYWGYLRPGAPRFINLDPAMGEFVSDWQTADAHSQVIPLRGAQVEQPTRKAA